MLIRQPDHVQKQEMTMSGAQGVVMRVLVGAKDNAPNFAMRQFEVSPGGHTPFHQHDYEHEVIIQAGSGQVRWGESAQSQQISEGDALFIPANELHQFDNNGHETLKFICLVPVSFDCGQGQRQQTPGT